jgi:hypothetical protein
MSEFDFNYSEINEHHQIPISGDLCTALRTQSRILLIPFFQKITLTYSTIKQGDQYPVLNGLAERIILNIYDDGELDSETEQKAHLVAIAFLSKLHSWQKNCLAFYFCTNESFINELNEQNELSDLDEEIGKQIQLAVTSLLQNDNEFAYYLVKELLHLQDIFSTEDIHNWDAASITHANEKFQLYAGKGQILIPIPIDEYDYWSKIIDQEEEDDDEEEE